MRASAHLDSCRDGDAHGVDMAGAADGRHLSDCRRRLRHPQPPGFSALLGERPAPVPSIDPLPPLRHRRAAHDGPAGEQKRFFLIGTPNLIFHCDVLQIGVAAIHGSRTAVRGVTGYGRLIFEIFANKHWKPGMSLNAFLFFVLA